MKIIKQLQENVYQQIKKGLQLYFGINQKSNSRTFQESNDKVSIGVCTPGALSLNSGLIKNSNTQCLIGKDFQNDLEEYLRL